MGWLLETMGVLFSTGAYIFIGLKLAARGFLSEGVNGLRFYKRKTKKLSPSSNNKFLPYFSSKFKSKSIRKKSKNYVD